MPGLRRSPSRPSARSLVRCLALAALGVVGSPAWAQREIEEVTPRWVVVTGEEAALRCGDRDRYYQVARLAVGTLVTIDGQSEEWCRAVYPESVTPFVPAEDVDAGSAPRVEDSEVTGRTVRLARGSGLRAPSLLMGLAGSWKSVYDPPLAAGTELTVVGVERNEQGELTGYRVKAPAPPAVRTPAYGYLRRAAVRQATVEEVQAHLGVSPARNPLVDGVASAGVASAGEAGSGVPESRAGAVDTSLIEPMIDAPAAMLPEAGEPASSVATGEGFDIVGRVEPSGAVADAAGAAGAEVIEQGGAGVAVEEAGLSPAELTDLEASFEAARALPREELDVALDELAAEYRRAYAASTEEAVSSALESRIDWLELRIATRDERQRLERTLAQVEQREQQLSQRVEAWRDGRAFTIVGRVLPSRVYDGVRLPLMYRVASVDPLSFSRTLGYVRPSAEDPLRAVIGQVVGIRGHASFDPELRLRIVEPIEVERLSEQP